jgi:hypothetical protein
MKTKLTFNKIVQISQIFSSVEVFSLTWCYVQFIRVSMTIAFKILWKSAINTIILIKNYEKQTLCSGISFEIDFLRIIDVRYVQRRAALGRLYPPAKVKNII